MHIWNGREKVRWQSAATYCSTTILNDDLMAELDIFGGKYYI